MSVENYRFMVDKNICILSVIQYISLNSHECVPPEHIALTLIAQPLSAA